LHNSNCTGPGDSRHAGRADLKKLIWTGVMFDVDMFFGQAAGCVADYIVLDQYFISYQSA